VIKKIVPFIIALCFIAISALPVVGKQSGQKAEPPTSLDHKNDSGSDSTAVIFPVKKTSAVSASEMGTSQPMDLPDPDNIRSSVVYDPVSGLYFFYTKVGNMDIATPMSMTGQEYQDYTLRTSMQSYWRQRNDSVQKSEDSKFAMTDMKFSLGPADKLFGPGGVQVKMQGSAELDFGVRSHTIDNPIYPYRMRRPAPAFDFSEKIQLNVNGKVGDKINLNLNYNTESSFDFDQKMIKLGYTGKEDEIIKKIEAGNVSLPLNSSLITGSSALFGVKTELQFGKLNVVAVASQQQSQTKTVSSKGGVQTTKFYLPADRYDANRHFFLSQYFRNNFDRWMNQLPYITSGVTINRVEVWVTNKRSDFSQARNIIAFSDIGEAANLTNAHWIPNSGVKHPSNATNSLYNEVTTLPGIRDIQNTNAILDAQYSAMGIIGSRDYEKVESARKLEASEYTINKDLGYISLRNALNSDEVLAVAYEFTAGGKTYQVGEFSTDPVTTPKAIVVKLLKNTNLSPSTPLWKLMMKNVYNIGASQMQKEKFKLNVMYESDSTGINVSYINEGTIKGQQLTRVMNLDNLDSKNEAHPDGNFDYIEGYTAVSDGGRIIFPVVEPFGSYLATKIGNPVIAKKYTYQELYDSTLTNAQQYSAKNKFRLVGEYKGTSGSQIQLNAMNVPRGSVVVTAGGKILTENQDYTVDYMMGTVNIINQSILASGTNVDVKLENQSMFDLQRKTLIGTHMEYAFSKDFSVGGTLMHLSELPLTQKVSYGNDPISNTIWGLNTSYRTESLWLTNLLNKIPLLNLSKPSYISLNAEFAQLIAGHPNSVSKKGEVFVDDFEGTKTDIELAYPYNWFLASTPYDLSSSALFPEATLNNNVNYGKNRALMSWFVVDQTVFSGNSSLTPDYIRGNKDLQSDNLTRQVLEQEIFPNRESLYGTTSYLPVLNVSYYPTERGPYNMDVIPTSYSKGIDANGKLKDPKTRWGGIMRKLETSDFESSNIEYIDFWMMDPFVNDTLQKKTGGDLYFNLGDISEDILKDGKKFFENGLSAFGDTTNTTSTVWGRLPSLQSTVLAFDNSANARQYQDVGLDGLTTANEFSFPTYKNYLNQLKNAVSPTTLRQWQNDPFSPLNDPAGDNYISYRNPTYNADKASILSRYKHYNGSEGNSTDDGSTSNYTSAATSLPDVEDLNQDNTLNQYENYYQYKVSLRRSDLQIGTNYLVDKISPTVKLKNGRQTKVSWYHFKIPIRDYQKKVGSINDFKSIRFMRMVLSNFEDSTFLRFGTLNLVKGDWRTYTQRLYTTTGAPTSAGDLDVGAVNIEEDGNRIPVNYVLPPGVTRQVDPSQPQIRQENEQSITLKVNNLAPNDARAVYKNTNYDMRQYKRLHMFTHAQQIADDNSNLKDYELTAFIRMGSDLTNNYYEYEVPLKLTDAGHYQQNSDKDRASVWPAENELDIALKVLTDLKKRRNAERGTNTGVSLTTPYAYYDPAYPKNKVTVLGNPNLANIQSIMIGVRNNGRALKNGEAWLDELSLNEFDEGGGWAGTANTAIALSDLGTVNASGRFVTAGFGSIEQNILGRSMDNNYQYNVSTTLQLGKFFPEKAKVSIPFYLSTSNEIMRPKYNPLDGDILLSDALKAAINKTQRDSILSFAETRHTTTSFNITNARVDIRSKTPQLYDPANFAFSYAYNHSSDKSPDVIYRFTNDYRGAFSYAFNTMPKPWEPLKNSKLLKSPLLALIRDFNLNFIPSQIAYNTNITRTYSQAQARDYDAINAGTRQDKYDLMTFSQDFLWDRRFDIKLDLTRGLSFSFSSSTNSRIDEPYVPVDKTLFPDEYKMWKDSIKHSIASLGRPLLYQQMFTAAYTLPINKLPYLDFITTRVQYTANYDWQTGVTTASKLNVGNTISSTAQTQTDGQFNFETLYNKIKLLSDINKKFNSNNRVPQYRTRSFRQEVKLAKRTATKLTHRLNSTKLTLTATDTLGRTINLRYKVIDANTIEIGALPKQTIASISITSQEKNQSGVSRSLIDYAARTLMMVRRGSISYRYSQNLTLPGFIGTSKWFGQSTLMGSTAPGAGFSFGFFDKGFVSKALDKGWLISNDTVVNPATFATTKDFEARLNLEPIPGLKIDLAQKWFQSGQTSMEFMYKGMPSTFTGSFHMSYIAIGTFFKNSGNSSNSFSSQTYRNFKANRNEVARLLAQRYAGQRYPNSGFMEGHVLAGATYSDRNGGINPNSADVLIPAFLAAYGGHSVSGSKLGLFPSLLQSLPNWRITFDGLSSIPFIAKYLKSLTLNHAYNCDYTMAAYSSYSNWTSNGSVGFIKDVTTGNPIPSSQYNIGSVTLTESFLPLVGVDATFKNSLSTRLMYNTQRNLSLNITSAQIMEMLSKEWVIGVGYMLKDFNLILKLKNKQSKVKNDLTLRCDFSVRDTKSLMRNIASDNVQPTDGGTTTTIKISGDYVFSSMLNIKLFYDRNMSNPLISTSYPMATTNFGVALKFLLTR